jgi:hypothetical protein
MWKAAVGSSVHVVARTYHRVSWLSIQLQDYVANCTCDLLGDAKQW